MPFSIWRRLSTIVWNHPSNDSLWFCKGVVRIIESIVSKHRQEFPPDAFSFAGIPDERSNAMVGSSLAMLQMWYAKWPESDEFTKNLGQAISSWQPLSPSRPSPMEYLIACSLYNPTQLASVATPISPTIETITLGGFLFSRRRRYKEAADILQRTTKDIIAKYGPASMQFGIAAAELSKCYNILRQEELSEKCVRKVLDLRRHSDLSDRQDQLCLKMALADSLVGRARYNEAAPILQEIIDNPAASASFRMMSILRLVKARRRMHGVATNAFEQKGPLRTGLFLLSEVPDIQRRDYLEEVACNLSALPTLTPHELEKPKKLIRAIDSILSRSESLVDTPSGILFEHASKVTMKQGTTKAKAEKPSTSKTHENESLPLREQEGVSNGEGPWARKTVLSFGTSARGSVALLSRNTDISACSRWGGSTCYFQSSYLEAHYASYPRA